MTLAELSSRAGISVANLAVLKNGRARAIRFSTLTAVCDVLECRPGDLLSLR
jgi:putative transcriptional regulator